MAWSLTLRRAAPHVLYSILLCTCFQLSSSAKCNLLNTAGITVPQGDITIEYGNPLEIYCILNDEYLQRHENASSEDIVFYKNNYSVPEEMVEIVNKSTIRLYIEKPPLSSDIYTCKLRKEDSAVCLNLVVVGTKPRPVNNFSCIGYNYENLTCSWDTPQNYVKTNYSLSYHFMGRSSRRYDIYRMTSLCPNISYGPGDTMHCFWSGHSYPPYRNTQPVYYFNLTATNVFGNLTRKYIFQHFAYVIPGPPEHLKVIAKGSNYITLTWNIPPTMLLFPPGLVHRIFYQSEFDTENDWHLARDDEILNKSHPVYNLTGLNYAHVLYDIRVSMRSLKASATDEYLWSKNASVTVRTLSAIPSIPPAINVGSFELVKNNSGRDIYVYWQVIPPTMKNGENFSYEVISIKQGSAISSLIPVEKTNAYAKFIGLNHKSYNFEIASVNEVGRSVNSSILYVPSTEELVPEPTSFTKIAFGDRIYELSWVPPKINSITNYTIFYCSNEHDRPFQCKGHLKWVVIPNNITMFNVTVPEDKTFQFAISANTNKSSSGMVWASCTVIHNKRLTKMKNLWIADTGSTFILVGWKLDCSDRIGSIEGFNIEYCPIISPVKADCKEPLRNISINDNPEADRANITNLKPYTTYMVKVSVISKHHRFGLQSDPLYNTTYEGAPEPPRNLKVYNVTNSSISLEWSPPTAMNGVLRYYEVHYMSDNRPVTVRPENEKENRIVLKGLNSFTNYNITVVAWTSFRSRPSEPVHVTTVVAIPGRMRVPNIRYQNESIFLVSWSAPSNPRGKLNLYELQIRKSSDTENDTKIIETTDEEWIVPNCANEKSYKSIFFSVRAINIDGTKRLEGPWSPENENYCRVSSRYIYWFIFILCIFFVILTSLFLRKVYSRCQIMSDVEVKLPPGLTPPVTTDIGLSHWSSSPLPKSTVDDSSIRARPNSPPDEQHLLGKGDAHDRITSGDSSGCSSGHESVTSSLASGTNLSSTSDSGTEQPRTPSSESASRENSLRQRRTGSETLGWDSEIAWPNTKGYVLSAPSNEKSVTPPSNWTPNKNIPGSNYCVLGVESASSVADQEHGYVPVSLTMSSVDHLQEMKKSPYVTCDSVFSQPEQLQAGEPLTLSPSYVKTSDLVNKAQLQMPSEGEQVTDTSPLCAMSRPYVKSKNLDKFLTGKLINIDTARKGSDAYMQKGATQLTEVAPALGPSYVKTGELCAVTNSEDCVSSPAYVKTDMLELKEPVSADFIEDSTSDDIGTDEELPLNLYSRLGWESAKPGVQSGAVGVSREPMASDAAVTPLQKKTANVGKGYVPHRHFENKSLKED